MMRTTLLALRERLTLLLALGAGLVLSACGGGSGSTAASSATTTTAAATVTLSASATSATGGGTLTLTWTSANTNATTCTASGAWSGQVATSGSQQVTAAAQSAAYTATYTLTCGAATNSVAVTVTPPQNTVAVTVDGGPTGATGQFNVPYVSVTVCRPGTTVCQTIDHIMVDTGSYGLRLIAPLDSTLALPAVTSTTGAAVGECGQFVSGYTWGAVVQADIKLGGETASAQSVQVIGQAPGSSTTVPSTCTSTGSNLGTVAALGANGILGVGLFQQDCGSACVASAVSGTYYACSSTGSGTCTAVAMPLAQQVGNPVAAFASDNNGVVLTMPTVNTGGATTLAGTLTFGIGTQDNNALGSATRYAANANGYFTVVYKGTTMSSSFIDSGSNGLFFNDTTIATCKTSTDFYCPASPLTLSATTMAYDSSASSTISFMVEDIDKLDASVVAAWVGGPNGTLSGRHPTGGNAFDLGLPFFFGRTVYVGNELNATGPYWAY
jgi:hypothetical protein